MEVSSTLCTEDHLPATPEFVDLFLFQVGPSLWAVRNTQFYFIFLLNNNHKSLLQWFDLCSFSKHMWKVKRLQSNHVAIFPLQVRTAGFACNCESKIQFIKKICFLLTRKSLRVNIHIILIFHWYNSAPPYGGFFLNPSPPKHIIPTKTWRSTTSQQTRRRQSIPIIYSKQHDEP